MFFSFLNFLDKITLKNHTKIHSTVNDYMIIFVLRSILSYIRNLKNYFFVTLFSSWQVLLAA